MTVQEPIRVVVESSGTSAAIWLSIISAAIAGVALAVTLWRELNDRPRVTVDARAAVRDSEPTIRAYVANVGRRPLMVGPLTLTWDLRERIGDMPPSGEVAMEDPTERHLLEPGRSLTHFWTIPAALPVHERTPFRVAVYLEDGRVIHSAGRAFLATLVRSVPELAPRLQTQRIELAEPPRGRRLVARWKLWRPRHLRSEPTDDPREASSALGERDQWMGRLPGALWSRPQPGSGVWLETPDSRADEPTRH